MQINFIRRYSMFLSFSTKNYKSFLDELVFSMTLAPKQKGLDYSILQETAANKTYKGLCSSVIYGANASGKTNIISAMDVFKRIILRGNIKNMDDSISYNTSSYRLELIPNKSLRDSVPTEFSIRFIDNELLFDYQLSIDLGTFLQSHHKRRILRECLSINEQKIYTRIDDELTFYNMNGISNYMINAFEQTQKSAEILAKNSLDNQELFLTHGFKMMFSTKIVNLILHWFETKFIVIYRADAMDVNKHIQDAKGGTVYIEKTINEAAKLFGIHSNALGYVVPKDGNDAQLCSIFQDMQTAIPAEFFESYGTVRFIRMFPLILQSLKEGTTLVLDEFDAHIHPMALMNIITLYHNDDINKKHAQLIFNTHNPIFLNANLFRRDEIKFVERDDDNHNSHQYALSDFKTSGANGVRKGEDYMNKYFIGRYGAIKEIDFYNLMEAVINKEE